MSTVVDKVKQKEDNGHPKTYGSTLFVSNLPYTTTSVDLQTLFSDIAPVRSAFVVTEHGTGVSKGVGYVSFALKEDAETAFETISQSGIELAGRKLRVQWAESKKRRETGANEGPPIAKDRKQKLPRVSAVGLPHDPIAIRTIVISGLPPSIDAKILWKKIRKYDGAEKVEWPVQSDLKDEDSSTAHVVFSSPAQAAEAVNKLHAHVYKGSLLSVTLKKRMDNLAKLTTISQKDQRFHAVPAPSHASRLIVRNIPFNASELDIRATFLPYGPIHSIHIPVDDVQSSDPKLEVQPDSDATAVRKPRMKGFAFVWMLSKKDAEKAIEGCNGTVLRAGIAQSMVSDKQKKKKERRLEEKRLSGATAEKEDGNGNNAGEKTENGQQGEGNKSINRVIAVDWALSKDRWEEERAKMEDTKMHNSSESDMSGDNDGSNETDTTNQSFGMHDSESEGYGSESNEEEDEEERVKLQLPPDTGTTVFIRNVSFDATEDELRTLFRSFGPLRYVRITKDPTTGRSRGSGFACFWNEADANRAVQQSELLQAETTTKTTVQKKNPFSLPSILTPDPSSGLAQNLVLHGRTLDIVMAVTRDVAGKLKEDNEKARQKLDKRNMHLLREGVILPNSSGAETLTPAEVEKRTSSFNARRALLKSNPSLYISKTRLSVRQIPTFVTERMLKRLALHSIKAFNAEVKQGIRDPLDVDELDNTAVSVPSAHIEGERVGHDDCSPKRKKFKGKESAVKQVKIVRQAERVDPITKKGKSRGYGFVELHKHTDALKFLRWANNNPEATALCSGQWWKEELESLLKTEKAIIEFGEDELSRDGMRMKRLREEIERVGDVDNESKKKSKGTLIVEFSIENALVVQRRNAKQQDSKAGILQNVESPNKKRKRNSEIDVQDSINLESQPTKRRRNSPSKPELTKDIDKSAPAQIKFANPMGSIIGRKRKERRKDKRR